MELVPEGAPHRSRGRAVAAGAILLASLLAGACGEALSGAPRTTETTLEVDRGGRREGDVERRVGDSAAVHGMTATVVEVGREQSYSEVASEGYLWARVSLRNTGGGDTEYHRLDWQLEKPDGTVVNRAVVGGQRQLGNGQLAPDEETEGLLIFSVGDAEGQFSLLYEPRQARSDALSRQRGVWVFESAPGS